MADAESFTYPCDRYQHDEHAIPWRDVAAQLPEAFEVLEAMLHTPERREKWRLLRSA